MKKIIFYLFCLSFLACSKKEDIKPEVVQKKLSKATDAYFVGEILGKKLSVKESKDQYFGLITAINSWGNPQNKDIEANLVPKSTDSITAKLDEFYFYFPVVATKDFSFEYLFNYFKANQFKIEEKQRALYPNLWQNPLKNVIFVYTTLREEDNKQVAYTVSTTGNQDGSNIEILEINEVLAPISWDKSFEVKLRFNAKLYNSNGDYVGDAKNVECLLKYYHKNP